MTLKAMLHDADDSSSCSDDDNDFLVRRSPRPSRSTSEPQAVKDSLSSIGTSGLPKYKTFDLGDGEGPSKDTNFLNPKDGGGYESSSSRRGSRTGSRSVSPAPGEAGDFVVISRSKSCRVILICNLGTYFWHISNISTHLKFVKLLPSI